MVKLRKRLEKLEGLLNPPKPKKWVRVIQHVGESREQAFARAGIVNPEANNNWIVRAIRPSPGNQLNEPRKY